MDERALERSLSVAIQRLELKPFDTAILCSVLGRAETINQNAPAAELFFCELDGDLQPWDRDGRRKPALAQLYDDARVWVYGDFEMKSPDRPPSWAK